MAFAWRGLREDVPACQGLVEKAVGFIGSELLLGESDCVCLSQDRLSAFNLG
jgi:hypothetical protein